MSDQGHPIGSADQRLGALEQDTAVTKTALSTLSQEVATLRERYHDTMAPTIQRLVIMTDDFTKTISKVEVSIATIVAAFTGTTEKLDNHIRECTETTREAEVNRRSFRREMRGYVAALMAGVVLAFLSQKFHFSISATP